MWAAKRPHEGVLLYEAAASMSAFMASLGIAIDGGKDSLSMVTSVQDETVISPGQLVILGYAPVPDIAKIVTPDLKGGVIGFIDPAGKDRTVSRKCGETTLKSSNLPLSCPV